GTRKWRGEVWGPRSSFVLTRSVLAGFCISRSAKTRAPAPSIPELAGIWVRPILLFEPPASGPSPVVSRLRRPNGTPIFSATGDHTNPILNPPAAEIVKKKADLEVGGAAFPSPHNQCWPEPTPFVLSIQFGMQIIQQKDLVLLLYPSDHQVRRVPMNVPHS